MKNLFFNLICLFLILFILFTVKFYDNDIKRNIACGEIHRSECKTAHNLNKTYLLCSGFMIEPSLDDNNYWCRFPPNRNCNEIIDECIV